MRVPDDATEHPEAIADARSLYNAGAWAQRNAVGQLSRILDGLFDGPGTPAYAGATLRVEHVFDEAAPHGTIRLFYRWFWGNADVGVIGVIARIGPRTVLMSVGAVVLGPGPAPAALKAAESAALGSATARLGDL
jgi:hypothetical protein